MLSPSFIRGLAVGVLIGFVVGHLASRVLPTDAGGGNAEVSKLRGQLEAARKERDGLVRNVEEFRVVAQRMSTAFADLERRFRTLEKDLQPTELGPTASPPALVP